MSSFPSSFPGGASESNFLQLAQRLRNLDSDGSTRGGELTDQRVSSPITESPSERSRTGPARQGREIQTDRGQDAAVEGEGFIVLEQGDRHQFTRSVSLEVDERGNVTDAITGADLQRQVDNEEGETETRAFQLHEDQRNIEA